MASLSLDFCAALYGLQSLAKLETGEVKIMLSGSGLSSLFCSPSSFNQHIVVLVLQPHKLPGGVEPR